MAATYTVYSYLGFRRAAWGVSAHTAAKLARALRSVSGCGWVVGECHGVAIDGREVADPPAGIVGGRRLCDAIRDPRAVVDAAWAN